MSKHSDAHRARVHAVADVLWIAIQEKSPEVPALLYKLKVLTTKRERKPRKERTEVK